MAKRSTVKSPGLDRIPHASGDLTAQDPIDLQPLCEAISTANYDHILVGGDLSTLYTAALLAKCGHRCCVLRVKTGPQLKVSVPSLPHGVAVLDPFVTRLSQYQTMLDVAVPFSAPEKRTLLEPLGSEKSGRVHTVVSCELSETGPLQEGTELDKSRSRQSRSVEFSFRSGQSSLAEDLAADFCFEESTIAALVSPMVFMCELLSMFLSTKVGVFPWKNDGLVGAAKTLMTHVHKCSEFARMNAKTFFASVLNNKANIQDQNTRIECEDMVHVLCAPSGWDLSNPSSVSALHIGSTLGPMVHQGCYVPSGGIDALYSMLSTTVTENGGMVCSEIEQIEGFVMEEVGGGSPPTSKTETTEEKSAGGDGNVAPRRTRVVGVMVKDSARIMIIRPKLGVISGLGVISTYRNVVLASVQGGSSANEKKIQFMHVVPVALEKALESVEEQQPKVLCVFTISKRCFESVSGDFEDALAIDYFRTRHVQEGAEYDASGTAIRKPPLTETGLVVDGHCKVWCPSARDRSNTGGHDSHITLVVEMLAGSELTSPSVPAGCAGPKTYKYRGVSDSSDISGFNVERGMGRYSTPSSVTAAKLRGIALAALCGVHPSVAESDVISFTPFLSPSGGHALAGLPSKYAADFKSRTPFENLYLCGCDVGTSGFAGDIQGGWVAANAVLGYQMDELLSQRSVTADLRRVL